MTGSNYNCYIVLADGKSELAFELQGVGAWEIYRQLRRAYPGAKVIRVFNETTGEEAKSVEGGHVLR